MVTPNKIQTAFDDNVRNNQIGVMNDGISAEVAADLGYETHERMDEILHSLGKVTSPALLKISEEARIDAPTTGPQELPEAAREAIARAHEIATRTSDRLMQGAEITAVPYVTHALRGIKVDGNRRGKRGR